MFKYLIIVIALISTSVLADVSLPSINPHYTNYKGLHDVMMHSVENDSNLSTAQKMAEYTKRLNNLKSQFRSLREAEYKKVVTNISKGNSCTKGYSGGSKVCNKYMDCPSNYFTKPEWTGKYYENGAPMNRQAIVEGNGIRVWSKIKKSSKGRYYEQIRAACRLKPLYIEQSLNRDVTNLFNRILSISIKN